MAEALAVNPFHAQAVVHALHQHLRLVALFADPMRRFDGVGHGILLVLITAVVFFVVFDGPRVPGAHHGISRHRHVFALPNMRRRVRRLVCLCSIHFYISQQYDRQRPSRLLGIHINRGILFAHPRPSFGAAVRR